MKKAASILILVFFICTLSRPSLFMLSIEKGKVYTECYCLDHIIKASCCSSLSHNPYHIYSTRDDWYILSHRHVQLISFTIPEETKSFADYKTLDAGNYFSCLTFAHPFSKPYFSAETINARLKYPFTTLKQTLVLLI